MAATYRIRFRLATPLSTPLHSGTLFGNLCWAWRYLYGEEELGRWLCSLSEDPFLISDGFPADHLPPPLLPPRQVRRASLEELCRQKKLKKATFIPKTLLESLREGLNQELLQDKLAETMAEEEGRRAGMTPAERRREGRESLVRVPHNRIHRLTGRTPEEGGLFFVEEHWATGLAAYRDVYVRTSLERKRLEEVFGQMARWGYGRDATWGRGRFDGIEIEEERSALFDGRLPRAMTLSHGSLSPNMRKARYRLETHYGRLGGVYSSSEAVFKHPLLLVKPGATFEAGAGPFGEMLQGVHPAKEWVRHNAWHLTVTFREAA